MKLIITQPGWTTFTGILGAQQFVNGVSVNDLTAEKASMVAAVMRVDWQNDPVEIVWAASTVVALNALVVGGANIWKATTAGTSAAAAPVWPASPAAGATVADGTVVWTLLEAVDAGRDDVTNPQVQQLTDTL